MSSANNKLCDCGEPRLPKQRRCQRCYGIEHFQIRKSGPTNTTVGCEEIGHAGTMMGIGKVGWNANGPDCGSIAGVGESFETFCKQHNL